MTDQKKSEKSEKPKAATHDAAAMKHGQKPGPKDAPVQVRNAGKDSLADKPKNWDKTDEALDESFPSSDATAKY